MRIGTVFEMPQPGSRYASVRDEFDNNRTVHAQELDDDHEDGDEFAYRMGYFAGGGVTMVNYEFDRDPDDVWQPDD